MAKQVGASLGRIQEYLESLEDPRSSINQKYSLASVTMIAAGRRTQLIDPLGRRTTSAYDVAGRQTLRLDARQYRTTYGFDTIDRLTSRKYPRAENTGTHHF